MNVHQMGPLESDPPYEHTLGQTPRYFFFTHYHHVVSASDQADGFELWFPAANGDGHHVKIWNATLYHEWYVAGPGAGIRVFLQSEDESVRVLLEEMNKQPGWKRMDLTGWLGPHGSRGILQVTGALAGDKFEISYLVETI